jgi:hypothetical protein
MGSRTGPSVKYFEETAWVELGIDGVERKQAFSSYVIIFIIIEIVIMMISPSLLIATQNSDMKQKTNMA